MSKKKKVIVFICAFFFFLLSAVLTMHYVSFSYHEPASWQEIWNDKWAYMIFCALGSVCLIFSIDSKL